MRWDKESNEFGAPGMMAVVEGRPGRGSHGSLSHFDLHNTLIAAGPDLKKGFVSQVPSGNVDIAPTVLSILGVSVEAMDGRVLSEALTSEKPESLKPIEKTIEANSDLGFLTWHQYLKFLQVGHTLYYDEGNGQARLKEELSGSQQSMTLPNSAALANEHRSESDFGGQSGTTGR
jgi:hypothetical protein